ncbi:AAA-like domain-containing protein [Nostoc sp.]|uniref:AAA-like domain-containing protein n=1 Tax=Nostoc sp. TaxID=1180 RepID=UPI002FF8AC5A
MDTNIDADTAVEFINEELLKKKGRRLSDLEEDALHGSWRGLTYEQISREYRIQCTFGHFQKNVTSNLWKLLSDILGEQVSKEHLHPPVKAAWRKKQLSLRNPGQDEGEMPFLNVKNLGDSQSPLAELLNFDYVERVPYEAQCYEAILQPGELLRIKAPQKMGKTWLKDKLLSNLAAEGFRTVGLSFQLADIEILTNLDRFLRWFCTNVTSKLGLPTQLDDYWDRENLGSKMSCTVYFKEYLLKQADTPLVLFLDDVDWIFPYTEISAEFFSLLRSWYDEGRSSNIFTRLRVVLIHSTQDYIRLDIERSPFNVGICIELSDFSQQQVQNLAQQYGLDWDAAQVEQLMKMVGGYPFLVQQALSHLKNHQHITLNEFLETAPKQSGIYGNYLRPLLSVLQENLQLASAFKKVVTAIQSVQLESQQAYKLHSMGLVEWEDDEVRPRCNLFRQYFCTHLGDS